MKVGTHSAATVLCTELRHNLHKFPQDLKRNTDTREGQGRADKLVGKHTGQKVRMSYTEYRLVTK